MNIQSVANEQKQILKQRGIDLLDEYEDLDRPWGGFIYINTDDTEAFIREYFGDANIAFTSGMNLQPKILMVMPNQRLSWQYHHRRAEYWRAVDVNVGYYKSSDDDMGELQTLKPGEFVEFSVEQRHRLVGLDEVGVVAEIWQHTYPNNPSDEDDIVRISDDYSRN